MDFETKVSSWSKPPSDTEDLKAARAEAMVKDAIRSSGLFSGRSVEVFAKGSYPANTNVRFNSDVDVCVLTSDSFFYELPYDGKLTPEVIGFRTPAAYLYKEFRSDVLRALGNKFGHAAVRDGNKAIRIPENTYRLDIDVVPCFEFRYYFDSAPSSNYPYLTGASFLTSAGGRVVNYPKQHLDKGRTKNVGTGGRYKKVVRILKRAVIERTNRNPMLKVPASFLVESLVFNIPDAEFDADSLEHATLKATSWLLNSAQRETLDYFFEANDVKLLFRSGQPWSLEDGKEALLMAVGELLDK